MDVEGRVLERVPSCRSRLSQLYTESVKDPGHRTQLFPPMASEVLAEEFEVLCGHYVFVADTDLTDCIRYSRRYIQQNSPVRNRTVLLQSQSS